MKKTTYRISWIERGLRHSVLTTSKRRATLVLNDVTRDQACYEVTLRTIQKGNSCQNRNTSTRSIKPSAT